MITVRREWLAKDREEAIENAKAYRERFDPSASWRVHCPFTGKNFLIIVYEDYESLAQTEEKWLERVEHPEWGAWIEEWKKVAVVNSLSVNYLESH